MKFAPFLAQILLAISATAIPLADRDQQKGTLPEIPPVVNNTLVTRQNGGEVLGWSGAQYKGVTPESKWTGIGARFKVPEVSFPAEYPDYKAGVDISIGIDGRSVSNVMLLAGIHCQSTWRGERQYRAFWEWWYTSYSPDVYEFGVSPGDEVQLSIKAHSPTSATILYENLSTGQKVSVDAVPDDASDPSFALQGVDAHWLVQNFEEFPGPIPPANFGQVKLTDMWAEAENGVRYNSATAELIDELQFYNRHVAVTKRISDTEIEITYTGPK